jgi:hypothetical protein
MTAGLRGSSSGMSFSTLPTRSAPTSAAWRGSEEGVGCRRGSGVGEQQQQPKTGGAS